MQYEVEELIYDKILTGISGHENNGLWFMTTVSHHQFFETISNHDKAITRQDKTR
jgi:hypothetical protein